jgi:hypothetical protein
VDALTRRIATARDGARAETYHRLAPLLAPPRQRQLDGLLDVDPDLGLTRLAWLRRGATAATPEVLKAELDKLQFLRQHGADRLDLSRLPAGRRRMLAEIGRRSTNQALQRADVDRRHPVLLATLAETYVEVLDELVQLLDQALAGADSRARHELSQRLVDRAKAEADRARLLDEVLDVLADPAIPDEQAGRIVRERLGMPRLIAARRPPEEREPRDHGHFDLLAARYKYLRAFTPAVIAALPLTGDTASAEVAALLDAVGVLRDPERRRTHRRPRPRDHAYGNGVRAGALARLPGRHPRASPRRCLPALLGTGRAVRSAGRAALRRPVGARLAPLHRPGHPAAAPGAVGQPARRLSAPSPAPTPIRAGNSSDSTPSCTPRSTRWRRSSPTQAPRDWPGSATTAS